METSPIDCHKLTTLKLGLNEKRSKLRTLDDKIVDLIGEEDLAAEIEQADDYMERIHEALAKMDTVLEKSKITIHCGIATDHCLKYQRARCHILLSHHHTR